MEATFSESLELFVLNNKPKYFTGKSIYLDSFVFSHIAKDSEFASEVQSMILRNGYTLVFGVVNLIEMYKNKRRLNSIVDFISALPFVIAVNPHELTNLEVINYPNECPLPIRFDSTAFSQLQLKNAIVENMESRVKNLGREFYLSKGEFFQSIKDSRDNSPNLKLDDLESFLLMNVMTQLCLLGHLSFLENLERSNSSLDVKLIKTSYVQVAAIFIDMYLQKKKGKSSDLADWYQLALTPYVDLSVIDREKVDTIERLNKVCSIEPINCLSISDFKKLIKE